MQIADKFKLWVALLLAWNSALLVITIILLLLAKDASVDTDSIAAECAAQARAAVETQCAET